MVDYDKDGKPICTEQELSAALEYTSVVRDVPTDELETGETSQRLIDAFRALPSDRIRLIAWGNALPHVPTNAGDLRRLKALHHILSPEILAIFPPILRNVR